jgi:signal transduction histidine kinase
LRPAGLTEKTLGDLIRQLIESVNNRTHMLLSFTVEGQQALPGDVQVALYRITQEAVNNIIRHSHASEGWVEVKMSPDQVDICIRDNGRGFDPHQVLPDHYGVAIMHERADAIGARFGLDSQIDKGTEVNIGWSRSTTI